MIIFIRLFICFIIVSSAAQAGNQELYLRRISFLLNGVPPDIKDLDAVSSLSEEKYKEFLRTKIDAYLESDLFAKKMRIRVIELLKMKVTPQLDSELFTISDFFQDDAATYISSNTNSVLDLFLFDLFKNNQSWDKLLTGNTYKINFNKNDGLTDLDFYQDVVDITKIKPVNNEAILKGHSKEEQEALAGVLTTPRFFERYFANKRNENRKRSAAIFSIFLCDHMQEEQIFSAQDKKRLIEKSLNILPTIGIHKNAGKTEGERTQAKKRHGSDPVCMSCHYKLDPLGKVFDLSALRPNLQKVSGRLTYNDKENQELVDMPFSNISTMAHLITRQKKYESCQIKHFWDWFVGDDVELSMTKKNILISYFNKNKRRPKDLIRYLLLENYSLYKNELLLKKAHASTFDNKFSRFIQNFDFYQSLKYQFNLDARFIYECRLQKLDLSSLGLIDPASGARYPPSPNLTYYQLLYKCSSELTRYPRPIVNINYKSSDWATANDKEKKEIILAIIKSILGEHTYSDDKVEKLKEHIFVSIQVVLKQQKMPPNITYVINLAATYIVLSEEYLTI